MIDKTEIKKTTGLVWFGNDLRIHDNEVLSTAIKNHKKVIGVYCIDPTLFLKNEFGFNKMDVFRTKFLLETLEDLQQQLIQLNISLLVFKNTPNVNFPALSNDQVAYKNCKKCSHEKTKI